MNLLSRTHLVLALASALTVAASPTALAASHHRSACQKLRGKDRAPAHGVKLVVHHNRYDGVDVLSCALPHGRVHTIAFTQNGDTIGESVHIREVAGAFAVLAGDSGDQYFTTTYTAVWNLRSGLSYGVASWCEDVLGQLGGNGCPDPPEVMAAAAFVARHGRAVAQLVTGCSTPRS